MQNGTSSSHKRKYEADEVMVDDDDEMADDSVVVLDHTSPKRPRVVTIGTGNDFRRYRPGYSCSGSVSIRSGLSTYFLRGNK